MSTKNETLLSLHGCKKQKESLDQEKVQLESNLEKCKTNPVEMNYRLAFVFPYEGFENTLICIISFGPSTRFKPILNFPIFRKNGASLELLNIVFLKQFTKRVFFGKITNKKKRKEKKLPPGSRYLLTTALKNLTWPKFITNQTPEGVLGCHKTQTRQK